jgi:hypothetical protein
MPAIVCIVKTSGSGTITMPATTGPVTVEVWGGAGGGGSGSSDNGPGGGGGAGGYARKVYPSMSTGATFSYNVGAGGAADTDGGDTWFGSTSTLIAGGGGAGNNADNTNGFGDGGDAGTGGGIGNTSYVTGNPMTTSIGDIKFAGGAGLAGIGASVNIGGAGGGSGTAYQAGTAAQNLQGIGTEVLSFPNLCMPGLGQGQGGNGAGLVGGNSAAVAGFYPGGGGGAGTYNASTLVPAAAGANGLIIITDSGTPPVNTYNDLIGIGNQLWNTVSYWSLGRIPQHGDIVNYDGTIYGPNPEIPEFPSGTTAGPTSFIVLSGYSTAKWLAGHTDSNGSNHNIQIGFGGFLTMGGGPSFGNGGAWNGNAASAAYCVFNGGGNGGLANNSTFLNSGGFGDASSGYPTALFGKTIWNQTSKIGQANKIAKITGTIYVPPGQLTINRGAMFWGGGGAGGDLKIILGSPPSSVPQSQFGQWPGSFA